MMVGFRALCKESNNIMLYISRAFAISPKHRIYIYIIIIIRRETLLLYIPYIQIGRLVEYEQPTLILTQLCLLYTSSRFEYYCLTDQLYFGSQRNLTRRTLIRQLLLCTTAGIIRIRHSNHTPPYIYCVCVCVLLIGVGQVVISMYIYVLIYIFVCVRRDTSDNILYNVLHLCLFFILYDNNVPV